MNVSDNVWFWTDGDPEVKYVGVCAGLTAGVAEVVYLMPAEGRVVRKKGSGLVWDGRLPHPVGAHCRLLRYTAGGRPKTVVPEA